MTSGEVRRLIEPLTGGTSSCKITDAPDVERAPESIWTTLNKHKELKDRDRRLIAAYFEVSARTGVAVYSDDIPLDGGGYLQPDKAVMNAGLNFGWLEFRSATGSFALTEEGWRWVIRESA